VAKFRGAAEFLISLARPLSSQFDPTFQPHVGDNLARNISNLFSHLFSPARTHSISMTIKAIASSVFLDKPMAVTALARCLRRSFGS
jgi:hypothetical protein